MDNWTKNLIENLKNKRKISLSTDFHTYPQALFPIYQQIKMAWVYEY